LKAILIDFGSTFTKILIVDVDKCEILKSSKSASTVQTDVALGLKKALKNIGLNFSVLKEKKFDYQLSCSSAAGGLKMVAIGLVPQLTVEAAKKAALGAGANVLGTYSYKLTPNELEEIETLDPDIILLSGGCDGGDRKNAIQNAKMLSNSKLNSTIIIACNKEASYDVSKILIKKNKDAKITENIMPELWSLDIEPAKKEIRRIFLEKIIDAKGLEKIKKFLDILKPTPSSTMKAAELLANGTEGEEGLGDLLTIEVGGATTNVYSVSEGIPSEPNTILRGFKEPYVKRTVEGDLGLRYNAKSVIDRIGVKEFKKILRDEGLKDDINIYDVAADLSQDLGFIPKKSSAIIFDTTLSRIAVRLAVKRHSGYLKELELPSSTTYIQKGKDLRNVANVIGTGGGIVFSKHPKNILSEALFNTEDIFSLRPKRPKLFVDKNYVMWGMGLLSTVAPRAAFSIIKKSLSLS
jgi:uncharacterized protein (TIGR01319 family)